MFREQINDIHNAIAERETTQQRILASAPLADMTTDLGLEDTLTIHFEEADESTVRGTHPNLGRVIYYKVEASTSTVENLRLYKNIQAGAYVQRLFGTARISGNHYAVFQDLNEKQTLAEACGTNTVPKDMLGRVSLAYDVAKTVAWYHRAGLLLKAVADQNIVLETLTSGKLVPFLTNLENARHVIPRNRPYRRKRVNP